MNNRFDLVLEALADIKGMLMAIEEKLERHPLNPVETKVLVY